MSLNGRKIITTPYSEITRENIVPILSQALLVHLANVGDIDFLFNYFKGIQPILNREKVYHKEINNKIVENHANEITTFKTGYLLWKPIQYVARKESVDDESVEMLNDFMTIEGKESKDKLLANHQSICGLALKLTLANPSYELESDEAPFITYVVNPKMGFVVYSGGFKREALIGVVLDRQVDEKGNIVWILQAYTKDKYYVVKNGEVIEEQEHTYKQIPLIEYPLNEERIGDFEKVISLLDAINLVQSNRLDGVEQFVQSLLLFKNVDIDSEGFQKLKEMGAIKIKDNGEIKANVEFLTQELNQQQVQTLKDDMYKVVLTICGMPNRNGGSSTSDTGSAVIMRDGWTDAEARANDTEDMFKASERKFLKLALDISRTLTLNRMKLVLSDLDIKFTRRNYENIYQKAQVLDLMLKNSKVAPRLAYVVCGLFQDPESAYNESKEYYEQVLKQEQEALLKGSENQDESKS